jgi:hypothetical protein
MLEVKETSNVVSYDDLRILAADLQIGDAHWSYPHRNA